ncbi:hypothetical protein N7488_003101 [Penicillium malachiteum]|nr:hypothetical protein N7488_003101 [Penicillium malachiteum]
MGLYPKKRKLAPKVEEVTFDSDARHEFLTGFHKRKVQRIKHAQEVAENRAREEKRQDRKRLREERAAEFNRAMEEHKRQLKQIKEQNGEDSANDSEDEDDQEWEGIEEPPAVDYEAEYIDEDKYTTVTVEEMDASREGLRKAVQQDDTEDEEEESKEKPSAETEEAEKKPAKKVWKRATDKPKKKKKQFRYESKHDRKLTQAKQRLSKSKKAKARREQ